MAKEIDVCIGGVIKKVKKVPICIGGVIKEAKKGFGGVGGYVKEFFTSNPLTYSTSPSGAGYINDSGYFQCYSGTAESGTGPQLIIMGVAGHKIKISTQTSASYTRVYVHSSPSGTSILNATNKDSATATVTVDCTSYTGEQCIKVYTASSKGYNYNFQVKNIYVDGESVMESLVEWANSR